MESAPGFFVGWTRFPLADGAIFVPPDGPQHGLVRVRERLPLRRFRALIDELIQEMGPAAAAQTGVGALERLTTLEGEHAALVTLSTRLGGQLFERTIALVAGDDWSNLVDGGTADPARHGAFRQAVRQLAESAYLGLGDVRQRRFEHRAPEGWALLARPHAVRYLHPAYPRVPTVVTVHEARPRLLDPAAQDDQALMFESLEEDQPSEPPVPIKTRAGLAGHVARFRTEDRGQPLVTARAYLADPRYVYRFHLECAAEQADDAIATLIAIAGSTEPIPAPRSRSAPQSAISHWVD